MEKGYNPSEAGKTYDNNLQFFIEDLRDIKEGKIPMMFYFHKKKLKDAADRLPPEEQEKYKFILGIMHTATTQVEYLRAQQIIQAKSSDEQGRLDTIEDFLKQFDD